MTDHEHDPVRDLIPFYVAGTLTDRERQEVEQALVLHPEWAADVQFWQHAANVVRAGSEHARSGHPPSDRLVDLAELGPGRVDPEWLALAAHVEMCTDCRRELAVVRATLDSGEIAAPEAGTIRSRSFFRSIPMPALAAAAVLLVAGVVLLTRSFRQPGTAAYTLRYAETTRSTAPAALPVIGLSPQDTSILLHVDIPHTEEPPESFEITIDPPGGSGGYLTTGYAYTQKNIRFDRLSLVIDPRLALPLDGRYRLSVSEVRPPGGPLIPEVYTIEFVASRRAP